MLKKIWPDIEKMGYCLYEIAVMDENGLQWKRFSRRISVRTVIP